MFRPSHNDILYINPNIFVNEQQPNKKSEIKYFIKSQNFTTKSELTQVITTIEPPKTGIRVSVPVPDLVPKTGIRVSVPVPDLVPKTGIRVSVPVPDLVPDLVPKTGIRVSVPVPVSVPKTGIRVSVPVPVSVPKTGIRVSVPVPVPVSVPKTGIRVSVPVPVPVPVPVTKTGIRVSVPVPNPSSKSVIGVSVPDFESVLETTLVSSSEQVQEPEILTIAINTTKNLTPVLPIEQTQKSVSKSDRILYSDILKCYSTAQQINESGPRQLTNPTHTITKLPNVKQSRKIRSILPVIDNHFDLGNLNKDKTKFMILDLLNILHHYVRVVVRCNGSYTIKEHMPGLCALIKQFLSLNSTKNVRMIIVGKNMSPFIDIINKNFNEQINSRKMIILNTQSAPNGWFKNMFNNSDECDDATILTLDVYLKKRGFKSIKASRDRFESRFINCNKKFMIHVTSVPNVIYSICTECDHTPSKNYDFINNNNDHFRFDFDISDI
jgi:hypothetical protein